MKTINLTRVAAACSIALLGSCFIAPEASAQNKRYKLQVEPSTPAKPKSLPVASLGGQNFGSSGGKATGSAPASTKAVGSGKTNATKTNNNPAGMVAAGGGNNSGQRGNMVAAGGGNNSGQRGNMVAAGGGNNSGQSGVGRVQTGNPPANAVPTNAGNLRTPGNTFPPNRR